jgi:hypothetical protein
VTVVDDSYPQSVIDEIKEYASTHFAQLQAEQEARTNSDLEFALKVSQEYDRSIGIKNEMPPEKQYNFGFGSLGNGTTVYNKAEEVNGDYKTVAHIGEEHEGGVKFYEDMPDEVWGRIIAFAEREANGKLNQTTKQPKLSEIAEKSPNIVIGGIPPLAEKSQPQVVKTSPEKVSTMTQILNRLKPPTTPTRSPKSKQEQRCRRAGCLTKSHTQNTPKTNVGITSRLCANLNALNTHSKTGATRSRISTTIATIQC